MGRKPKNKYIEASIAWVKDSEFRMFYVKIPKWLEVKIAIIENGQYHGTETHLVSVKDINREEFVRKIKKLGRSFVATPISLLPISCQFFPTKRHIRTL